MLGGYISLAETNEKRWFLRVKCRGPWVASSHCIVAIPGRMAVGAPFDPAKSSAALPAVN